MGKGKTSLTKWQLKPCERADEQIYMRGRIVIGEGERMKPHALYREEVGICTVKTQNLLQT